MPQKELNIGQLIKDKIDEQHWCYADFARAICCSRSSLYNIFQNRDITVGRLLTISRVLGHDFIADISRGKTHRHPELTIPFVAGRPDISHLPEAIIDALCEAIEERRTKH